MENKNVLHRIKNSYFSLDYISGGCSHVLWAVGWCSTPGEEGWGTPDFRRWPGWSKEFLGVWNFRFRGSLIEAGFFLIVKTYAFWKFLLLGLETRYGILLGFDFCPQLIDHPCHLKSGVHTPRGVLPRGGTWVFFGWACAARDSKLAPRSKKNFP